MDLVDQTWVWEYVVNLQYHGWPSGMKRKLLTIVKIEAIEHYMMSYPCMHISFSHAP